MAIKKVVCNFNNSTVSVSGTPPSRHDSSGSSAKEYSDEDSTADKVGIKGKKRKRSKREVLEEKVMKTMTDGLSSSDKMFNGTWRKKIKFEQQQRCKEWEFQVRMIQMLQRILDFI